MSALSLLCAVLLVFGGTSARSAGSRVRVMTYNIHHGEGTDGNVDLERLAAVIKKEKPDVVALQEVDRGVKRTKGRDEPAELAKLTGMNVCFERNLAYQGGDYGNAILTRFPILQKTNTHYQMIHTNEQRGALQAVLDVNGRKLLFISTHIDYRDQDTERLMNVAELQQMATGYNLPTIICGDFNATPDTIVHERMARFMDDTWLLAGKREGLTWPARRPIKRIDYIWAAKAGPVEAAKVWVPNTDASDHRPVVGDFVLK